MKLYKNEFGSDFDLGINLDDYTFLIDKSYANDMCPSFYFKLNHTYYILWVDHAAVAMREDENNSRYTVCEAENLGSDKFPELQTLSDNAPIEIELVEDMIIYLKMLKEKLESKIFTH
ncbi:MAG: hypothetical protein GW908_11205 [Thiomicrospira sp.]|nr:hypothetical protein [Thiomicrospira sp.]